MRISNVTAKQKPQKGLGQCPRCGRGRALVEVKPRPVVPGEVTTYCRWPDCGWSRIRPIPDAQEPGSPR